MAQKDPMEMFKVSGDDFGSLYRNELLNTQALEGELANPRGRRGGLLEEAGLIDDLDYLGSPEGVEPWESRKYKYGEDYGDVQGYKVSSKAVDWDKLQKIVPLLHEKESRTYYTKDGKLIDKSLAESIGEDNPERENIVQHSESRFKYDGKKPVTKHDYTRHKQKVYKEIGGVKRELTAIWNPKTGGWDLQDPESGSIVQESYNVDDLGSSIFTMGSYDDSASGLDQAHTTAKFDKRHKRYGGEKKSNILGDSQVFKDGILLSDEAYNNLVANQLEGDKGKGFDRDWTADKYLTWDELNSLFEGNQLNNLLAQGRVSNKASTPGVFDLEDAIFMGMDRSRMGTYGTFGEKTDWDVTGQGLTSGGGVIKGNETKFYESLMQALENEEQE